MLTLIAFAGALLVAAPAYANVRVTPARDEVLVTIVSPEAPLYGRPDTNGTVLGIVRRGETAHLLRRSVDRRWCQIDIGAGELAWIDARAVQVGGEAPARRT